MVGPYVRPFFLVDVKRHTDTYFWTSMLRSIDSCQKRVSADQYYTTLSQGVQLMFLSFPLNSYWFLIDRRLRSIFSGGIQFSTYHCICHLTLELVPLFRGMQEQSIYMLPAVHFFVWRQSLSLRVYLTLPLVSGKMTSISQSQRFAKKLTVGYPEQSLHHLVLWDKGFARNAFCRSASSFLICKTWKDQF